MIGRKLRTVNSKGCRISHVKRIFAFLLLCIMVFLMMSGASAGNSIKPRRRFYFGHYPYTKEGTDRSNIEWLVLDVKDEKALVISVNGIDTVPYHSANTGITWENSSVRAWLNDDFLNAAFTAREQAAILPTTVMNTRDTCFHE